MTAHHLLHKIAAKNLHIDQARVILSLATRGKTVNELRAENPGLCHCTPVRMTQMEPALCLRQRIGRAYIYRLTEAGFHTARLIFDAETEPTTSTTPDSPPLPFS